MAYPKRQYTSTRVYTVTVTAVKPSNLILRETLTMYIVHHGANIHFHTIANMKERVFYHVGKGTSNV